MEYDLDAIVTPIEKLDAADLIKDGVRAIVDHVVCDDRRLGVTLECEYAPLQKNFVLFREKVLDRRELRTGLAIDNTFSLHFQLLRRTCYLPAVPRGMIEDAFSYPVLNLMDRIPELLGDSLALQCLDSVRLRRSWHDDECHDRHIRLGLLESEVEAGERLDEHVHTLVAVLIPTCRKHIQCIFDVEVEVTVEVSSDEFVDFVLRGGM